MQENELESVTGSISRVIYKNEENGYTVLVLDLDDGSQGIVVGCIPMASAGEDVTAWGQWERNAKHGEQFKAEIVERSLPTDVNAIYNYLAGRAVKGIGPKTASLIVSSFGANSLTVIRDHPEQLAGLRGFNEKKAKEISENFRRQTGMRVLMEYLGSAGIGSFIALRLYRLYGEDALAALEDNPYIISDAQIGAKFSQADLLALSRGVESDSLQRITAGILYELRHNAANGHCFLPVDKLTRAAAKLLSVEETLIGEGLTMLQEDDEIYVEPVSNVIACYTADYYAAECYVAARLRSMAAHRYEEGKFDSSLLIEKIEGEQNLSLAPRQRETIEFALKNQVLVITGGPGTGKTTSLRAVLSLYDELGLRVQLAAPTGQASKRLSQVTCREASTLHRLLEANFSPTEGIVSFRKNEKDRLSCDALVIDECSMVDISLMRAVLAAIGPSCRLVLVGDADQLPSVGPGFVFRDIIRSGVVQTVSLSQIFRQAEGSMITTAAHDINSGKCPNLRANRNGFYYMQRRDPQQAAETIVSLCKDRLPDNMGIPSEQIQVLSPSRKGEAGTENLNRMLQQALNPLTGTKNEFEYAGKIFREGDRVMQIRNNYDIVWHGEAGVDGYGIFNGDIGIIRTIDPAAELMTIDYDGRMADYFYDQASELDHAWATTVHKSQGSEYRAVVLALCGTPAQLQYRGILYTAVSRASDLLVIVGDENLVDNMSATANRIKRYTGLLFRLREQSAAASEKSDGTENSTAPVT